MHPDSWFRRQSVTSRFMSNGTYPTAIVEAGLRQSIREQQWVLEACAELGFKHAHLQPPRKGDELGTARNPYTVWAADGQSELLASFYLEVTEGGVQLVIVEGRRPDGRTWTLPAFAEAHKRVLDAARRDLASELD
jgi:hypothetical protein